MITFVRKIDDLGRLTLPVAIRRRLGLNSGAGLEIYIKNKQEIVLQQYYEECTFCGRTEDLRNIEDKWLCDKCVARIVQTYQD